MGETNREIDTDQLIDEVTGMIEQTFETEIDREGLIIIGLSCISDIF